MSQFERQQLWREAARFTGDQLRLRAQAEGWSDSHLILLMRMSRAAAQAQRSSDLSRQALLSGLSDNYDGPAWSAVCDRLEAHFRKTPSLTLKEHPPVDYSARSKRPRQRPERPKRARSRKDPLKTKRKRQAEWRLALQPEAEWEAGILPYRKRYTAAEKTMMRRHRNALRRIVREGHLSQDALHSALNASPGSRLWLDTLEALKPLRKGVPSPPKRPPSRTSPALRRPVPTPRRTAPPPRRPTPVTPTPPPAKRSPRIHYRCRHCGARMHFAGTTPRSGSTLNCGSCGSAQVILYSTRQQAWLESHSVKMVGERSLRGWTDHIQHRARLGLRDVLRATREAIRWLLGPGKYVLFRAMVGGAMVVIAGSVFATGLWLAIPILLLDLFLTFGLASAALAAAGGVLMATIKVGFLLLGGSRLAQGLEEDNARYVLSGVLSIFGAGLMEGADGFLDGGVVPDGTLHEVAAGSGGEIMELGSDGWGPADSTYGLPSSVDGELRNYHYVEPYVRADGTPITGHWKSHPG